MVSQGSLPGTQALADRQWGSGFLPSRHQGVKLRNGAEPVLYLNDPVGLDRAGRRDWLSTLGALNQKNFERYKPLVAAMSKLDMQQLSAVYVHFYPLFQQAYQNLGYPNGYFNDRLVEVIDAMLASPEPKGPIQLVRPNVMYTFADPALEARPAGQKLLIRMGPENAQAIKAKLTELRAAITAGPLKHQ